MSSHHRIEQLTSATPQTISELTFLTKNFDGHLTLDYLKKMIDNPLTVIFVALDDNHIIGMATMITYHKLSKYKAFVEDVAVHEKYRRKGIGKSLMKAVIDKAKELRIDTIHLTSNSKRVAANMLYQKLGFRKYDTNYYMFDLT